MIDRDTIIKLAREAGGLPDPMVFIGAYERFAALVSAHEREACAAIADAEMNPNPDTGMPVTQYQSGIFTAAEHIAAAIRARGNHVGG